MPGVLRLVIGGPGVALVFFNSGSDVETTFPLGSRTPYRSLETVAKIGA